MDKVVYKPLGSFLEVPTTMCVRFIWFMPLHWCNSDLIHDNKRSP